ncbi:LLM class flavin-dependent oxidoreductase [Pseudomonas aeruginosa]|nr:LLM class flavin-dependent oxidoreductase [Pseudomonas aeruginosa]
MSTPKRLHIGMSLAPTWLSGDAWRRPDSNIEGIFGSDFAVDIARRSEAAHLDFVFRPDVSSLPLDVLETGSGFASLDPTVLLAAVARETSRIGLVSTVSTTFYPPYVVARQLQSLHWISNGRAGWNIVTALQGHENFGLDAMPDAEQRYARAAEFTRLVHDLWDSFPREALLVDRESGRYADVSRVHPVDHDGEFLKVKDRSTCRPSARRGFPGAGRRLRERARLRRLGGRPGVRADPGQGGCPGTAPRPSRRAERHGRSPRDVRLLPGFSLYLAESREEAREIFMQTHARLDRARKFATIRQMLGLDLSDWPLDRPISAADLPPPVANPGSRTHTDLLRRLIERETLRLDQLLLRPEVVSAAHWRVIGTVDDAVEQIVDWPPPAPWTVSSPRREARSARCGCSSNRWCRAWWKRGCSASATAPLPSPGTWQRNDGKGRRRPRPGGDGERVTACGLAA